MDHVNLVSQVLFYQIMLVLKQLIIVSHIIYLENAKVVYIITC